MSNFEDLPLHSYLPSGNDKLRAVIDVELASDIESLAEVVDALTDQSNKKLIEEMILTERRTAFMIGVVAQFSDPTVVDRLICKDETS